MGTASEHQGASGVRPMVRQPVQSRAKATVEAILTAAVTLLRLKGYAGLTTNEVAARAGVSIGALYDYFPNKDVLLDTVRERYLAQSEAVLLPQVDQWRAGAALPPLRDLISHLIEQLAHLREGLNGYALLFAADVPIAQPVQARALALEEALLDGLSAALARHPQARVVGARAAARLILETIDALTLRWAHQSTPRGGLREVMIAELSQMVTAYIGETGGPDTR